MIQPYHSGTSDNMAIKLILHLLVFTLLIAMCKVEHASGQNIQSINIDKECIRSIQNGAYLKPNIACFKICSRYDMARMCSHMDNADEKKISIANFVCLARDCGKPVPPGTQCASKYLFFVLWKYPVLLCYYIK